MRAGGPGQPTSDMTFCGVYYAVVTQNKDEELGIARVRVKLPWLSADDQTYWAQLAVPMVGPEFGTYVLPEVGDVVYVVFLAGDIRHPVVVSGNWNKTDTPPETNADGKNDFRLMKSRSGHRVILDDSQSAKVALHDKTDTCVVGVGTFAKGGSGPNATELPAPAGINGSPSQGVAIAAMDGPLNLWCPNGNLTVESMHVELTAGEKGALKAKDELALEGAQGKATSQQVVKIEGSQVKVN